MHTHRFHTARPHCAWPHTAQPHTADAHDHRSLAQRQAGPGAPHPHRDFVDPLFWRLALAAICGVVVLLLTAVSARAEVFTATHSHVLSHEESRNEARQVCLLQAKRAIVEQAGTWVEVETRTENYRMTKDEIRTFAAALVEVVVTDEQFALEPGAGGPQSVLTLTVRAEVDTESIPERVRQWQDEQRRTEAEVPARVAGVEEALAGLQAELTELQALNDAAHTGEGPRAMTLGERLLTRDVLAAERKRSTLLAWDLVEPGMSRAQVATLAEDPVQTFADGGYVCERHGDAWVVYARGSVACVRTRLSSPGDCDCQAIFASSVKK